jgi:hypothetical protein
MGEEFERINYNFIRFKTVSERLKEIESGNAKFHTWEEVKARIQMRIDESRQTKDIR